MSKAIQHIKSLYLVKQFNLKGRLVYSVLVILSMILIACDKTEEKYIPPLSEGSKAYFDVLKSGDKKDMSSVFFMPLHPKDIKHLITRFNRNHNKFVSGKLKLNIKNFHQKGRWGLITLNKTTEQKEEPGTLWFFYYQNKWRYISPEIYSTKELRAMMNLYPEYEELKKWIHRKRLGSS